MSEYTLHHGDCLDILPTLEPQSVDAIICDPPYGTTACKWDSVIPFAPMWDGIKRVLRPRRACVLFGSQPFTSALVMSNPAMFRYEWVWNKVNRMSGHLNTPFEPMRLTESLCVFAAGRGAYNPQMRDGKPYRAVSSGGKSANYGAQKDKVVTINEGSYFPINLLNIPADERGTIGRIHPTQKPLALLEYLVKTYTNEGETVLDFTMGSGTTGHACGNLGRRFIGIEKDAGYYAIASERIATAYAPLRLMQVAV